MPVRLDITGIARAQPAIRQRFPGSLFQLVVAGEYAPGAHHDLAVVADFDLDARQWPADRVQAHFLGVLQGIEGTAFGLAIELAQFHAQRAVKNKSVLANGLAASEGISQAGQAQLVLDRPEDQPLAQLPHQTLFQAGLFSLEFASFGRQRGVHENIVEPFLERRRILHANLDGSQHVVPTAGCRQIESGRDLAQVVQHRFLALGNVDGEVQRNTGADRDRKVAHPGHGQVGEDGLAEHEGPSAMGVANAGQQISVAQHDPFGFARGARRVDEHGGSVGLGPFDQGISQFRFGTQAIRTDDQQLVPRHQSGIGIAGQATRLIVNDVVNRFALITQIEHLVDLLLVFGQDEADIRLVHEVTDFVVRGVGVYRHGVTAQHAGCQHAHIKSGPVVAQHQQGIFAIKPKMLHARRAGQGVVE